MRNNDRIENYDRREARISIESRNAAESRTLARLADKVRKNRGRCCLSQDRPQELLFAGCDQLLIRML